MKFFTLTIATWAFLSLSHIAYAQTAEETQLLVEKKAQIIQQFNIYEQDHRGLVIYFSDQQQVSYPVQASFNTLQEAIESYFYGTIRRDMVSLSVNQPQSMYASFNGGVPIDMNQSIEKYIELFNQ